MLHLWGIVATKKIEKGLPDFQFGVALIFGILSIYPIYMSYMS